MSSEKVSADQVLRKIARNIADLIVTQELTKNIIATMTKAEEGMGFRNPRVRGFASPELLTLRAMVTEEIVSVIKSNINPNGLDTNLKTDSLSPPSIPPPAQGPEPSGVPSGPRILGVNK